MHLLGQTTNVVVAFNYFAGDVQALNAVRVDGTLGQPFCTGDFLCLCVEHLHEVSADNLSFLFRVAHPCQVVEEFCGSIHADYVQPQTLIVVHHIAELIFSKHAVVNEDAGQILAYGAVQQHGCHRRVNTARQAENHAVVAQLGFQLVHSGLHKRCGTPVLLTAADAHHEILQQQAALCGMEHLGVELHAP